MAMKRSARKRVSSVAVFGPHKPPWILMVICVVGLSSMWFFARHHAERVSRQVYTFQHQLLPRWVHGSDGLFYSDIVQSPDSIVQDPAREMLGEEYADAMTVELLHEPEGILISFPPPADATACFFAFITPVESGTRYLTLEKTEDPFNLGYLSFLCEWSDAGMHLNHGERTYTNQTAFLKDLSALL